VATLLQDGQVAEAQLQAALQQVCPAIQQVLNPEDETQCSDFVRTYGSALINVITKAQGVTEQACQNLGLCDQDALYKVLDPSFDPSYSIATYEASESNIASGTFYYKIFTGGLANDEDHMLEISMDSFEHTSLFVTMVDETGYGSWLSPIDAGDYVEIHSVVENNWYYITVNATYVGDWSVGAQGKFHLQVVYESQSSFVGGDEDIDEHSAPTHGKAVLIGSVIAALACSICCCCCVRRMRRNCKRNGGSCCKSRSACAVPQKTPAPTPAPENDSVALEMNQVPQPMMYYYAPTAPVAPQQMMYFMPQSDQVQYVPMQFAIPPQQDQ